MSKPTNATPKPLSDEELAGYHRVFDGTQDYPSYNRLLATIDALKAQPTPVPLAEDEALIAELNRDCFARDACTGCMACESSKRLTLRSGQLAQALALQRYGLSPHAPECGLFRGKEGAWVRYSELKAAIEGAK